MNWLDDLRPGDLVDRMMGGSIRMRLRVKSIGTRIVCEGGWEFDPRTGAEIDDDIPTPHGVALTVLVPPDDVERDCVTEEDIEQAAERMLGLFKGLGP